MMPRSLPVRVGTRYALIALAIGSAGSACAKKEPAETRAGATSTAPATPAAASFASKAPPVPAPPAALGIPKVPANNPTTPAKVALGHRLFFDVRLSADGSRSCYSCHKNEDGTGGHEPTAIGAKNTPLTRHSPTLWNVAYLPRLYWDGRSDSLEAQAKAAWAGGNMGVGADHLAAKAAEIGALPEYQAAFEETFPGYGASAETVVQALSAYERTIFCADTRFDKHLAGDSAALNADEKAGLELFIGKAACHGCHTPPFFSDAYINEDGAYHNVGVGIKDKDPKEVDVGRQKVSENPSEWAAFKTPSLRHVTRSAPYLHDGSMSKLEDVVRFMAGGGYKNPALDPKMVDKKLSDDEVAKIIAFLGALECPGSLTPPASL